MGDHYYYGDQINMQGGQVQIGKIVGPDAAQQLAGLISALQANGFVDAQGMVVDHDAAAARVKDEKEKGRLNKLQQAVRKSFGTAVQATAAGTAAQLIVRSLE
ncbi:hypothetical protein [Micromonospora coxensis]|uniref:Uncharacterized protein n=1 Tax=Micromonospora coxensis TaxID=356852 RepID=A0A1C5IWM5_9ACTN|nr:hypothetical protein [Micromonospora coxensis]SCG62725.1 hypothetical protein GA0070614_3540 [Micromonospora coxensis]